MKKLSKEDVGYIDQMAMNIFKVMMQKSLVAMNGVGIETAAESSYNFAIQVLGVRNRILEANILDTETVKTMAEEPEKKPRKKRGKRPKNLEENKESKENKKVTAKSIKDNDFTIKPLLEAASDIIID